MQGGSEGPWGRRRQGGPDWDDLLSRLPQLPGFLKSGVPFLVAGVIAVLWLASGFYTIQPGEEGVVTQFGKVSRIGTAGLNYALPGPSRSYGRLMWQRFVDWKWGSAATRYGPT